MNNMGLKIRITLIFMVGSIIFQGCAGKTQTVAQPDPLTCSQVMDQNLGSVYDHDLYNALDGALAENDFFCWKQLVKKSLVQNRILPISHLSRAVHRFNKNKDKKVFSLAVHAYFTEIIKGKKRYDRADRKLMKAYVGLEIRQAKTKTDPRLRQAKKMCRRLDLKLYNKIFS